MTRNFVIRTLQKKDIPSIVAICKESFPNSLKWQGPRDFCIKYWETILETDSAVAHVITHNNEVQALSLLVTDIPRFNIEKKNFAKLNFRDCLRTVSKNPSLAFRHLKKTAKSLFKSNPVIEDALAIDHNCAAWVELVAVSGKFRRKGLAEKIHNYREMYCRKKNIKYIGNTINSFNKPALKMVRKFGYRLNSYSKGKSTYIKTLS